MDRMCNLVWLNQLVSEFFGEKCDIFFVQFCILDAAEVLSASLSWINKDWSVIANVTIFMVRCLLHDYFFLIELHLSFCRQLKKLQDQDRKSGWLLHYFVSFGHFDLAFDNKLGAFSVKLFSCRWWFKWKLGMGKRMYWSIFQNQT